MTSEIDLLEIERGSVSAPAGCGKTHVVTSALARHSGAKPILVLTHTNAGVVALKSRLEEAGVKASSYRLSTLDGWAMRLIRTFPSRSGHDPAILRLARPAHDYNEIRRRAALLLSARHLDDLIPNTYERLLVDEYQDCNELQHAIVGLASQTLRTCVLGDPLQAIFGFAGRLVDWNRDVRDHFPPAGELTIPWRWINAGEQGFGEWLLEVRARLMSREPVDLRLAPPNVQWLVLDGHDDRRQRLAACRTEAPTGGGKVLIIGDSRDPPSQRRYASETPGAMTVEGVELRDLVDFARNFSPNQANALFRLGEFADLVMSGAEGQRKAAQALRTRSEAPSNDVDCALKSFLAFPSYQAAIDVLVELGKQVGVRTHRPSVLSCCIKALHTSDDHHAGSFFEAATLAREENRLMGRSIPLRAVGSTLLLKGLEADVSVVLDVEGMDAAHLYVAMTRGSRKLVVCSRQPLLRG